MREGRKVFLAGWEKWELIPPPPPFFASLGSFRLIQGWLGGGGKEEGGRPTAKALSLILKGKKILSSLEADFLRRATKKDRASPYTKKKENTITRRQEASGIAASLEFRQENSPEIYTREQKYLLSLSHRNRKKRVSEQQAMQSER